MAGKVAPRASKHVDMFRRTGSLEFRTRRTAGLLWIGLGAVMLVMVVVVVVSGSHLTGGGMAAVAVGGLFGAALVVLGLSLSTERQYVVLDRDGLKSTRGDAGWSSIASVDLLDIGHGDNTTLVVVITTAPGREIVLPSRLSISPRNLRAVIEMLART